MKFVKNYSLILEKIRMDRIMLIVEHIYILNQKVLEENYEVVLEMLSHIEQLFKCLQNVKEQPEFKEINYKTQIRMIHFLKTLIESKNSRLLLRSRKTVYEISVFICDKIYNNELLTMILTLLHDPINENNRIDALIFISNLYKRFEQNNIEGFIATDILALMQDVKSNVRKEAYKSFFQIFSALKIALLERKFMSIIYMMNEDQDNDIRLIFIKNVPLMSKTIPFKIFEEKIMKKYLNNLNSKNRFFKEATMKNIGNLIKSLIENKKSGELMNLSNSHLFDKLLHYYFNLPSLMNKMGLNSKREIIS